MFLTTRMVKEPVVTDRGRGAIGVDLNADHLAVSETDASGNPVSSFSVPLVTYGRSRHQAEAIIGDAVASVVAYARETGKPIVLEKLDFRQKKAVLEGESPATAGCSPPSVTLESGPASCPRASGRGWRYTR